jgi:DNA-directed RNA polymerase I, II, and III subunit RPABC3
MTTVFEDTFEITAVNPEKKIFDRVDRLKAQGETYGCEMLIDVNCELWRVTVFSLIKLLTQMRKS